MKINLRIILFGIVSGLIWSLIPFLPENIFNGDKQGTVIILAAGVATGIAVSFTLKVPLMKWKLPWWILGILSLPLGVFIFTFLLTFVGMIEGTFPASGGFHPFAPLFFAFFAAALGIYGYFYLIPVSILTTFLLRMVIRRKNEA